VRKTVWRHIRFQLPDDWEMLQFSRDPSSGSCLFADRYSFRFELDWRKVPGPPDMDRVLSDYSSRLREEKKIDGSRPVSAGEWKGIEARIDGILTTRFGRYFRTESCLVETVFLWPAGRDPALEQAVLSSFDECPAAYGSLRRWTAFGLDLLASSDLTLDECEVKPALARMVFRDVSRGVEEIFERLGMVGSWLKTGVPEWMESRVPKGFRPSGRTVAAVRRHEIKLCSVEAFRKFRRYGYRAAAWICPNDGRLYHVSVFGPLSRGLARKADLPQQDPTLPGLRLKCCDDIG
jgi:hypothetical protein